MKFPVNVIGKKPPHKHSVNDENDINKANVINVSEVKLSTKDKQTSDLLLKPKILQPKFVPDMVCATPAPQVVYTTASPHVIIEEQHQDLCMPSEKANDDSSSGSMERVIDEGIEISVNDNDEEHGEEIVRQYSSVSSLYDDSGFNSSASEDRDDISVASVNCDCDCEDEEGKENVSKARDNRDAHFTNIFLGSDKLCRLSEETEQKMKNTGTSLSSEVTTTELNHDTKSDSSLLSKQGSTIELSQNRNSILARSLVKSSRKCRTDVVNELPSKDPGAHVRATRRRRARDCNNNVTSRNIRSYLMRPPFKMDDCFQNRGLLCLAACIAYTLFLVIVCGMVGLTLDIVRSFISKGDLKEMRRNAVHSSRKRLPVNSG